MPWFQKINYLCIQLLFLSPWTMTAFKYMNPLLFVCRYLVCRF